MMDSRSFTMNTCPSRHLLRDSTFKGRIDSNCRLSWDSKTNLINKKKKKNKHHNLILQGVQGRKRDQQGGELMQEIRTIPVL